MIADLLELLRGSAPTTSPAPEVLAELDAWTEGDAGHGWVLGGQAAPFWAHFASQPHSRTIAWVPLVQGSLLALPRGVAAATAMALDLPFYRHGPAFWDDLRHWLSPPPPDSDPDPERFLLIFDGVSHDVDLAAELAEAPLDANVALLLSTTETPPAGAPAWTLPELPTIELPKVEPAERASLDLLASPTIEGVTRLCSKSWLSDRMAVDPDGALFDLSAVRLAIYELLISQGEHTASLIRTWARAALLEGRLLDEIGPQLPCSAPAIHWTAPGAAAALRGYELHPPPRATPTAKHVDLNTAASQLEALAQQAYPHHRIGAAWRAAGAHPGLAPTAANVVAAQSNATRAWLLIEHPRATLTLLGQAHARRIAGEAGDRALSVRAFCAALPHLPEAARESWAREAYAAWSPAPTSSIVAALPWLNRAEQVRVLKARYEVTERWSIANDSGAPTLEEQLATDHKHWSAVLGDDASPLFADAITQLAHELE